MVIFLHMNQEQTGFKEGIVEEADALSIKLSDEELVRIIDQRLKTSVTFWDDSNGFNLSARQKKIEDYVLGKQINEKELHPDQKPYKENVMWEAYCRNRAIMMGRVPDIEVTAGNNDPMAKQSAETLTKMITGNVQTEENKEVLSIGCMNRPLYFFGMLKARWNSEVDNYEFTAPNPKRIVLDSGVTDFKYSRFVGEFQEVSIKEIMMRFPDKADEFYERVCGQKNWSVKDQSESKLATTVNLWEVWFKEYQKVGDKWEKVVGVVWKYFDVILGKMKHPYWDWEGKKKYIKFDDGIKKELTEDEIRESLFEGDEPEYEMVFRNYLSEPEFPYKLIVLNRIGKHQIDETTNYEQVLEFQDNINREGIQINDMNSRSAGKEVFNTEAFDDENAIEEIDPKNTNQIIKVTGRVTDMHKHIDYMPATPQLYKSKDQDRSIAFEMMALNATTRGTREPGDETLGARQMMREQDFGVLDYEVSRTMNPAAQWMGRWMMQFIKLFYGAGKMAQLAGKDGEIVRQRISQDLIMDGMEVKVSASGVDKEKRKNQAQVDAAAGISDPLSYFEDTDQTNPRDRALKSIIFKLSPPLYIQKYLKDEGTAEMLSQQLQAEQPKEGMV